MEKHAIILIGLQASGKSTCYHRMWKDDYVHINLDTLHTRNKERLLLEECLRGRPLFCGGQYQSYGFGSGEIHLCRQETRLSGGRVFFSVGGCGLHGQEPQEAGEGVCP